MLCCRTYLKLSDHLKKAHRLNSREEREPYMVAAYEKVPGPRCLSESL